MNPSSPVDPVARARSRRLLVLLACLFFGPILLATALYQTGLGPTGRVNHGELLNPARPLPALPAATAATAASGADTATTNLLVGHWTLLIVANQCAADCLDTLYRTRQIRTLLNREAERVQRFLVVPGTAPLPATSRGQQPDLRIIDGAQPAALALRAALDRAVPGAAGNGLYLIDPLGNLVMSYRGRFENTGLLADLKKLLQLSSIG